jgi:hypothetical protein
MIAAGLAIGAVMILPAALYLAGVRWSRYLFGTFLVLGLLLWTPSPLAQHAIDRHIAFWILWALVEVFLAVLVWRVFSDSRKKEPIQPPVPTRGNGT